MDEHYEELLVVLPQSDVLAEVKEWLFERCGGFTSRRATGTTASCPASPDATVMPDTPATVAVSDTSPDNGETLGEDVREATARLRQLLAEGNRSEHPAMMTVEDVARRLKMSDSFMYNAIASGRLKHHRFGKGQGGIRVSEEQLGDFLRRTERGGTDERTRPTPEVGPKSKGLKFRFLPPS